MVNLSSSCLPLVLLWCADKRLFSAVALVCVGRALFVFFSGHIVVSSFVIALSVVVSCATDFMTFRSWLK